VKYTIENIRTHLAERGFILISETYPGYNKKLRYLCKCGKETQSTWRNLRFHTGLCKKCRYQQVVETTKSNNGGRHHFQTETFKGNRKKKWLKKYGTDSPLKSAAVKEKRRRTNLRRYGVPEVSQVPDIQKRQREGFRRKYGVNHFMENPASMAKYRQTLMDRYGVPSLAYLSRRSSKESQQFFTALFQDLPVDMRDKCYFSPRSREFNVWRKGRYFKYDFVHSRLRKCIEYNGSRFHPHPDQKEDEVGWCLFRPRRTVKEAREYEDRKFEALFSRGFQVLVIWDYEVKHDLQSALRKCLDFLLGSTPGNLLNPKPAPQTSPSP